MLLYGMHDREGLHLVPPGGFCLDTIALSEKPNPVDYRSLRSDINWIVRLNWGYGSTGTYPPEQGIDTYIQRAVDYVLGSKGIYAYIPGNEPNHENERPEGRIISPKYAATVFSTLRRAIRPFNRDSLALTVPVAPYHASPMDWLYYLKEMLSLIANNGGADGIGIHAYVRGGTPDSVYSSDRMGPPLSGQYNSFRTYRDALSVVPSSMKRLPAFITETNTLTEMGWPDKASGLIPAIYDEIDMWNKATGTQKVFCVCMYRYPKYDQWYIEGKNGVIADFNRAVSKDYKSPTESIHLPFIPNQPVTQSFEREIDPRAVARGVKIEEINLQPGETGWKVKKIEWFDEQQSDLIGPDHHILVDTLNELGNRIEDTGILYFWPTGKSLTTSEAKPGEIAASNYPMSPSENEFSVKIVDYPYKSETVTGIGMGQMTPDGFNPGIHTSTLVVFQLVTASDKPKESFNWQRSIDFVLRWEGGLSSDPNDLGNYVDGKFVGTKYGISARSYPNLDIVNLTLEQAKEIYYNDYWLRSGADNLSWPLCLAHFDLAVNGGIGRAQEALQESGNSFVRYMAWRIAWYARLNQFELYGRAWIRRCSDLMLEADK